tara:strand:+ start:768 stop:1643 length:876 start_codon:yes stop_codon:yes gene_type:complete
MAYLGNTPAERFSSMQYQDFTGVTGSPTAKRDFTLNHSVGSANEIEVFVNNVRQEPSVAYTVSGTLLSMTGDVETTDDFYVVFQGLAQQTATHPPTHGLIATTGTFNSTLSVTGAATATGGLNVGTIKDASATTTAMTIDSSGRILTPARPAFSVYRTDSSLTGISGQVTFNNTHFDIGSNWNTNYFEVPIDGIYMFSWNLFTANSSGQLEAANSPVVANIEKSTNGGSSYDTSLFEGVTNIQSTAYREQMNLNGIIQLNANDRVRCHMTTGHAFSDTRTDGLTFTGFLVG